VKKRGETLLRERTSEKREPKPTISYHTCIQGKRFVKKSLPNKEETQNRKGKKNLRETDKNQGHQQNNDRAEGLWS